jgi:hypothetical protein
MKKEEFVIIEKINENTFLIPKNSSLVKIIEFGFILHSLLIEEKICDDDEFYNFSFYLCIKTEDLYDDFIFLNDKEIKNLLTWLDWICKIIINSDGYHNETSFIKSFINISDKMFKRFKLLEKSNLTKKTP